MVIKRFGNNASFDQAKTNLETDKINIENRHKGTLSEIQEEIDIIKAEIEHHMQSAMSEPGTRDAHFADAERLLDDLKKKEAMLAKLKGALETEVKNLDEAEKIKK